MNSFVDMLLHPVLQCKNLVSKDLVGGNDPFVRVTVGSVIKTTNIHHEAGHAATFNETFILYIMFNRDSY